MKPAPRLSDPPPLRTAPALDNGALIRRLFALTWRYRAGCVKVLGIQLVLLSLGIGGLSFTGLGIDYIRHRALGVPMARTPWAALLPESWDDAANCWIRLWFTLSCRDRKRHPRRADARTGNYTQIRADVALRKSAYRLNCRKSSLSSARSQSWLKHSSNWA